MANIIKLNVSGTLFEATKDILIKIPYFKYLFDDTDNDLNEIIFIGRSPHMFKHVLALAIDDNYNFPIKYKNELDFYDMKYDYSKLHDPFYDLENNIIIKIKNTVTGSKCKLHECKVIVLNDNEYCVNHTGICLYAFWSGYCEKRCDDGIRCDDHKDYS